jgi:hypothetical protein
MVHMTLRQVYDQTPNIFSKLILQGPNSHGKDPSPTKNLLCYDSTRLMLGHHRHMVLLGTCPNLTQPGVG